MYVCVAKNFRNTLDFLCRVPLVLVGNKSDLHLQR